MIYNPLGERAHIAGGEERLHELRLLFMGRISHWLMTGKSWVLIGQSIRRKKKASREEGFQVLGRWPDLSLAEDRRVLASDWSIH